MFSDNNSRKCCLFIASGTVSVIKSRVSTTSLIISALVRAQVIALEIIYLSFSESKREDVVS